MSSTLFNNRTVGPGYNYDSTAGGFSDTWAGFSLVVTQVNGDIPPIPAEIILYYLVSATDLNPTLQPISTAGLVATGNVKFMIDSGADATIVNNFTINNGITATTVADGLVMYQQNQPVTGSYLYVWLYNDICAQPCTFTMVANTLAVSGGGGGGTDQVFQGNYSGGAPPFTPATDAAIAIDNSTGQIWEYWGGSWH